MPFDNDDLKRLKERLAYHDKVHKGWFEGPEEIPILLALLARLEVAEECAEYLDAMENGDRKGSQAWGIIQAWRKACGK